VSLEPSLEPPLALRPSPSASGRATTQPIPQPERDPPIETDHQLHSRAFNAKLLTACARLASAVWLVDCLFGCVLVCSFARLLDCHRSYHHRRCCFQLCSYKCQIHIGIEVSFLSHRFRNPHVRYALSVLPHSSTHSHVRAHASSVACSLVPALSSVRMRKRCPHSVDSIY